MQANIFPVKSRLLVDAQMLELLKAFHHYLFDNVLRLVKGGLVFVPDKAPVNVIIVPLRRGKIFRPIFSLFRRRRPEVFSSCF